MKSRKMTWAGNAACFDNMKETNHSEELGVDGRRILEWILGKQGGKVWTGFIWFRIGIVGWLLGTQ
jgi:hypothetical protein